MADIKGVLKKLFPFISAAASLGGPLGSAAASAVGAALGVDKLDDESEDGIAAVVAKATPEQMIALRAQEHDFELKMKDLGFKNVQEMEKIAASDRDSARKRQMELRDKTPDILAYIISSGFFGILFFMMWKGLPASESSKDALLLLLGALGSAFTQGVVGYFFGSSSSSAKKDQTISDIAKQP